MRATGINAFAAPVCQRGDAPLAEQRAEPPRQIATDHVAILRIGGPAGHHLRQDRGAPGEPALQRVFEVEQAQVVFAPLAHHDRRAAIRAQAGPGAAAFAAQLALQRLGVSRNPDRAAAFLRPQRCRGEIAQRLARAGAGLRQQHVRRAVAPARGKHAGNVRRISALGRARLCAFASQVGKPLRDLCRVESDLRGLGPLSAFVPFGQAGKQPAFSAFRPRDAPRQQRGPGPAHLHQRLQRAPRAFAFGPVGAFAGGKQGCRRCLQQRRDGIVAGRFGKVQSMGQPLGRRHHEARWMDEGIEFQQIQPRQVWIAQSAGHQRRVEQDQRRVSRRHDRVALGQAARHPAAVAEPAAAMAGMKGGKGKRGHRIRLGAGGTKSKHACRVIRRPRP